MEASLDVEGWVTSSEGYNTAAVLSLCDILTVFVYKNVTLLVNLKMYKFKPRIM